MNRTLTITICLLILLPSALIVNAQRLLYSPDIPVEKVRIILEQTKGGTISEMLTDLEYIPLEGSRGNLVDYISSVKVLDDRIGIVTSNDGYFYLYSIKGKLIKKITKIDGFKQKQGNALFYHIEKEDGGFLLFSHGDFSVKIDREGNVLDTATQVYKVNDDFISKRFNIGKGKYSYTSPNYDEKKKTDRALMLGDSVLVRYNVQDTIRTFISAGDRLSQTGLGKEFFAFSNNYKLFELNEGGVQRVYDFVFPFRNTMDSTLYTAKDFPEYFKYLNEHPDKIYGIGNPTLYKNYLLLYIARWHNPRWIVYNLETHETLGLDHIIPDRSNDFLEFYDNNHIFSDGEYLYSFIYPQQIRSAKNKSMDERHTMRKEYIDLEKNNNPVLVRFKIK